MKTGVLLFHGIAGLPAEFRYLSNVLEREGHLVSTPVIPGLGCGTDVMHMATWEDWLLAAENSLDKLESECDQVIVGGLSAGATLALKLGEKHHQRISGLLLLAPTLKVNGWSIPWSFKFFTLCQDRFVARLFNFSERDPFGIKDLRIRKMAYAAMKAESGCPSDQFFKVNGMLFYQLRRLRRNLNRRLHKITMPVFLVHSRDDDQSHISNAFSIQKRVSGPLEALILDDSFHVVTLDRQRQKVADAVSGFIAQVRHARSIKSQPLTKLPVG